ncbi:T9SS type A sorting domain-containing protein, partial [Carboxylicivirga sp. M1479]|uniref:T9SS type A sorting domain-containing protein n=3 Tax=Carboxylicivirga TaxID=1628153 RepID=UPI001C8F5EE8
DNVYFFMKGETNYNIAHVSESSMTDMFFTGQPAYEKGFVAHGNNSYIVVDNAGVDKIYMLDGSTGTKAIDINGDGVADGIEELTVSGDNLYFFATDATDGRGLYVLDLTTGLLTRIADSVDGTNLTAISKIASGIAFEAMFSQNSDADLFAVGFHAVNNTVGTYLVGMDATFTGNSNTVSAIYAGTNTVVFHSNGISSDVSVMTGWPTVATVTVTPTAPPAHTMSLTNGGNTDGEAQVVVPYMGNFVYLSDDGTNEVLKYAKPVPMSTDFTLEVVDASNPSYTSGSVMDLTGSSTSWNAHYVVGSDIMELASGTVSTVATSPVAIRNEVYRMGNGTYVWIGEDDVWKDNDYVNCGYIYHSSDLGPVKTNYLASRTSDFAVVGNKLFINGYLETFNGGQFQVSMIDFSAATPEFTQITSYNGFAFIPWGSNANAFEVAGDNVYFFMKGETNYNIAHVSESSMTDMFFTGQPAYEKGFVAHGNNSYVVVDNAGVDKIYMLDGATGTKAIDINGDAVADGIEELIVSGDNLYFFATDATTGRGLYVYNLNNGALTRIVDTTDGTMLTAINRTVGGVEFSAIFSEDLGTTVALVGYNDSENLIGIYDLRMDASFTGNHIVSDFYDGTHTAIFHSDMTASEVSIITEWPTEAAVAVPPSVPTSLDEELGDSTVELTVGPNPVSDILRISGETVTKVDVYNLAGAVVLTETGSNITSVNMSSLNSGLYIVNVVTVDGTTKTVKIQKR